METYVQRRELSDSGRSAEYRAKFGDPAVWRGCLLAAITVTGKFSFSISAKVVGFARFDSKAL